MTWSVAVFAQNEADTILKSLNQFPATLDGQSLTVTVIANGCTDHTETVVTEYAKSHGHIRLHRLDVADKSIAWNTYIHELADDAKVHFFTDANKTVVDGSLSVLATALRLHSTANAAAALPRNGWSRARWRKGILRGQQVAGGLYALRLKFIERLRDKQIRIPKGTLCDDAIISLFAADNLGDFQDLPGTGIVSDRRAGFYFRSLSALNPKHWIAWYRRQSRITLYRYQEALLKAYIRRNGLNALPEDVNAVYPDKLMTPTAGWLSPDYWFHRQATKHIFEHRVRPDHG